jgi:hypothetical protein
MGTGSIYRFTIYTAVVKPWQKTAGTMTRKHQEQDICHPQIYLSLVIARNLIPGPLFTLTKDRINNVGHAYHILAAPITKA